MNQQVIYMVSYSIIATLSALASLFMLILHIKIKKLRKHPGGLVLAQCITQFIFDIHWYSGFPHVRYFLDETLKLCKFFGVANTYIYFLSWNYLFCLSIEIVVKLTNRGSISYKKRLKMYHLFSHLVCILVVVLVASLGDFGISTLGTCFIKEHDFTEYLTFIPLAVHLPLMWFSVVLTFRKIDQSYAKALYNYSLVVLSMSLTLSVSVLVSFIAALLEEKHSGLCIAGAVLGSMTGLMVACSRLWNKKLLNQIRECFCRRSSGSPTPTELETKEGSLNIYFLSEMFLDMNAKTVMQMLALMILRYRESEEIEIEADHRIHSGKINMKHSIKFKFQFEHILELGSSIGFKASKNHISPKIQLREYKPFMFAVIRKKLGYTPDSMIESLSNKNNFSFDQDKILLSGGRSESFIFTIANGTLVLKTISNQEKKVFLKTLFLNYAKRIINEDESRLARIIGVFKMYPLKQNFLVMENIAPFRDKAVFYDLKGSTVDRLNQGTGPNATFKDQDFLNRPVSINIDQNTKEKLFQVIKKDVKIFMKEQVMDYSLLFGVYSIQIHLNSRYLLQGLNGEVYALGIIDFFQVYNFSKKTERNLKVFLRHKPKNSISAVSPRLYYSRFVAFLKKFLDT